MWLVCKDKIDGRLFITSRSARNSMLSVLQDLGQEIPSIVLKECGTVGEAEQFIKDQNKSDNDINNALKS